MNYGMPIPVEEVKARGDDWTVSGYASTFGNTDLGGDIVLPGAFDRTLKSRPRVSFLHSHDPRSVLGKALELRVDKRGLFGEFKISHTTLGEETRQLLIDGAMGGFSIGYAAQDYDIVDGIRQLKDIELYEVSVVAMPMNEEAVITGVKDFWPGMTMAEKARALTEALAQLLADTRALVGNDERPLNQTKRQELGALLETFSALDDVRSDLKSVLTATSLVDAHRISSKLAALRAQYGGEQTSCP